MTVSTQPPILVLCRDLLFTSKIAGTARSVGANVILLRDATTLNEEPTAQRLIVDLGQEGFLDAAAEWKRRTGGHVTGFVSHVDTETISRAEASGVDSVLARGAFVARLGEILK